MRSATCLKHVLAGLPVEYQSLATALLRAAKGQRRPDAPIHHPP
jgi:hypothetical protein